MQLQRWRPPSHLRPAWLRDGSGAATSALHPGDCPGLPCRQQLRRPGIDKEGCKANTSLPWDVGSNLTAHGKVSWRHAFVLPSIQQISRRYLFSATHCARQFVQVQVSIKHWLYKYYSWVPIIKGVRDSAQHCARESMSSGADGLEGKFVLVSWFPVPALCVHSHDHGWGL